MHPLTGHVNDHWIVFNDASIANSASDNLDENSRVEIMLECGECGTSFLMTLRLLIAPATILTKILVLK